MRHTGRQLQADSCRSGLLPMTATVGTCHPSSREAFCRCTISSGHQKSVCCTLYPTCFYPKNDLSKLQVCTQLRPHNGWARYSKPGLGFTLLRGNCFAIVCNSPLSSVGCASHQPGFDTISCHYVYILIAATTRRCRTLERHQGRHQEFLRNSWVLKIQGK